MADAFDLALFRASFPEFAATAPDALNGYYLMAAEFIGPSGGYTSTGGLCFGLRASSVAVGRNLMVAHIAKSFASAASGGTTGVVTGATEGSVSVSLMAPPSKNGWQYWLSSTPYGLQLWALLHIAAAGGTFVGGSLERASFRKAGGVF